MKDEQRNELKAAKDRLSKAINKYTETAEETLALALLLVRLTDEKAK